MDIKIGIRKRILIWITGLLIFLGLAAAKVAAEPRVLPDSEWREDVETAGTAIRDIHPRPFRATDQATFDAAEKALLDDLPNLSDKEIIVRLAAIVALVDDGHTRLAIPREHPAIGLEFGHTPTALWGADTSLKALLRQALERSDLQQVARHTLGHKLSPDTYADSFAMLLLELGNEFKAKQQADRASLAYQVGLYFYPDDEELKAALDRL